MANAGLPPRLCAPLQRWEHRAPAGSRASPEPAARPAAGRGGARRRVQPGGIPLCTGVGAGPNPRAWLGARILPDLKCRGGARLPRSLPEPTRAGPDTPAPLPGLGRDRPSRAPAKPRLRAGGAPCLQPPRPAPRAPLPAAHTPVSAHPRPPAAPLPSGAGEGQARLVPASNLPQVNSGFPRPAGSAWAPGPPGGREGGERRVLPGLPPPPLLEADRRYKRPGRGPAVALESADAQAVGRGRSGRAERRRDGRRQRGARRGQPQCVDYRLLHYAGATVPLKGVCTRPAGLDCSAAVPYEEGTSECGRAAAGGTHLPAGGAAPRLPAERSGAGPGRPPGGECTAAAPGLSDGQGVHAGGGSRCRRGTGWGREVKGRKKKIIARSCPRRSAARGKVAASGRIGGRAVGDLGWQWEKLP